MGAKANIIIDQGADFATSITVSDTDGNILDLTNYTGRGQIRKHYTSSTKVDFTIVFGAVRTDGVVNLSLTNVQTAAMEAGRYVYDAELIDVDSNVSRMLEGIATITPEVTR